MYLHVPQLVISSGLPRDICLPRGLHRVLPRGFVYFFVCDVIFVAVTIARFSMECKLCFKGKQFDHEICK